MAAHDDKISTNRRRLFKALSAVPVVATLRPGIAAATSAYQCVLKDLQDSPALPYIAPCPPGGCPDEQSGFAYRRRYYFERSDGTAVPDTTCPPSVNGTIVSTRANNTKFYNMLSTDVSNLVTLKSGTTPEGAPIIDLLDGTGNVCVENVPGQLGLFAVVVQPLDENLQPVAAADAQNLDKLGIYPKWSLTGQRQMITGSCWTSITGGALPNAWKLTDG